MSVQRSIKLAVAAILVVAGCSGGPSGRSEVTADSVVTTVDTPLSTAPPSDGSTMSTVQVETTVATAAPQTVWGDRLPEQSDADALCRVVETTVAGSGLTAELSSYLASGTGDILVRCALGIESTSIEGWVLEISTGSWADPDDSSWSVISPERSPVQVRIQSFIRLYDGWPRNWSWTPIGDAIVAAQIPVVMVGPDSGFGRLCHDLLAAAGVDDGAVGIVSPGHSVECSSPTDSPQPIVIWDANPGDQVTDSRTEGSPVVWAGNVACAYLDIDFGGAPHPTTDMAAVEAALNAAFN